MLLTRPERLKTIAKDLVKHFVGRGFSGKAMYVGLDKPSAVRMYGFVQEAWSEYLAELKTKHDALPELERPWLASRVELMETTDMAVVISQSQNELKTLDAQGLDIRPHRERMNNEDLAEKFKDPEDPLRIVFVCAMWMTGFDAPSVSTIYLDRPMRNHTLMQTIARANRVFPDKDNGLIVDYVGVFRNLEKALAIYGSADTEDPPILNLDELADELENAVGDLFSFCSEVGADLGFVRDADGFDYITHLDDAVEKLLVNTETQTEFQLKARTVRRLFKALLPDERAVAQQRNVSTIRKITERIADVTRPPQADLGRTRDAVDALLDRSVGAEEYLIRVAAEGSKEDPFIDLGQIDFEELTKRLSGRKRAETDRLAQLLKQRALRCAMKNPTRHELVERIERLIDEYNEGSINSDEYLRRLVELSKTLNEEEGRVVREGLTEEELAIFDLLTRPVPVLTEKERDVVKAGAKKLLSHLHEKLVQDWRQKVDVINDIDSTIRQILDEELPDDPYPPDLFTTKVQLVYDHVLTAYGDDGESAYSTKADVMWGGSPVVVDFGGPVDPYTVAEEAVDRIHRDPAFAAYVAEQLAQSK
ncbi:MAG: type I restriction enzyme endonuclease domain-containing protein [Arcanobacterium sp.]